MYFKHLRMDLSKFTALYKIYVLLILMVLMVFHGMPWYTMVYHDITR